MSTGSLLIVDDEPEIREILASVCARNRLLYREAASGEAALEILRRDRITSVLSDITMPGRTSGLELLRQVRAEGRATPFGIITAHDTKIHLHEALALGATDFIGKPFSLPELEALILKLADLGSTLTKVNGEERFLRKKALYQANRARKTA